MDQFEEEWRSKIKKNISDLCEKTVIENISRIHDSDPVKYTRELVRSLKNLTLEEKIKQVFLRSACHIPHSKLERAKKVYERTNSISRTRQVLEEDFKVDIKEYKNITDEQVQMIINNGWGLAGTQKFNSIVVTKIPSMFHEYFEETDEFRKKFYYCHCPRVKKELLNHSNIDSIYCNCGGGFYKDIWEYITGNTVDITVLKNLFDGDDVCQFLISFTT